MNYTTERNERKARSYAIVLAIGLHLSLGAALYFQMSDSHATTTADNDVKVNVAKEHAVPTAKTVSQQRP